MKNLMSEGGDRNAESSVISTDYEGFKFEVTVVYIFSALLAFLIGLILAFNRGPQISSSMISGGIIAYLLAAILFPKARWVPLMITLGLHIGAVLSYYSNPMVLPLVTIERWGERSIINIDVVQLILACEIVAGVLKLLRQNLKAQIGRKYEIGAAVV